MKHETTEDFKERIAKIRGSDGSNARRAHPSVVRKPGDHGYREVSIRPRRQPKEVNPELEGYELD